MRVRLKAPFWRRALRLLGRQLFRVAENNDDPRFHKNGERWWLRQLVAARARSGVSGDFVVFDGGANTGGYTREVLAAARAAACPVSVHAFEPSPVCLAQLRRDFAGETAVRVVEGALSDRAGQAALHDGGAGSSQASLMPRAVQSGDAAAITQVPLMQLGEYLAAQGLTHVDLLKLDVEGSELAALRGLGERLRPDIIDVIQFEYGGAALDAGTTLRDLYQLLVPRGYTVAKLFPTALEAREYRPWMEHYAYANYVAVSPRWLAAGRGST